MASLLEFKQDQLSQHSVFEISKLKKEGEPTSNEIKQAIESLTDHFEKFMRELQEERVRCAEKLKALFDEEGGEILQTELTELLESLQEQQIIAQQEVSPKGNN